MIGQKQRAGSEVEGIRHGAATTVINGGHLSAERVRRQSNSGSNNVSNSNNVNSVASNRNTSAGRRNSADVRLENRPHSGEAITPRKDSARPVQASDDDNDEVLTRSTCQFERPSNNTARSSHPAAKSRFQPPPAAAARRQGQAVSGEILTVF